MPDSALQKMSAVVAALLPLLPDEGQREALGKELLAAQEDAPMPDIGIPEGAVGSSQVERLKTAIELLTSITGESTRELADNVISQAILALKALVSEGCEQPAVNDVEKKDAPPLPLPIIKVDESFKGGIPTRVRGRLLESVEGSKNRFRICVVESGESLNRTVYPIEVLRARVQYYENRPMHVDHSLLEDGPPQTLKDDVSTVVNARIDEQYACSNGSTGAIVAEAVIHDPEWLAKVQVPEFRQRIGISHIAQAITREGESGGHAVRIAEDIMPERVDWVSKEGAGGRVLESEQKENRMSEVARIDESMGREVRRLRAKDEAREILMLHESLDPITRNEIVQEIADIAERADRPIDVRILTEAISKRYEAVIERATKRYAPSMPGAAGGPQIPNAQHIEQKAAESLGETLFGKKH